MEKKDLLRGPIQHIDIKMFDAAPIIDSMRNMSFTARDTARASIVDVDFLRPWAFGTTEEVPPRTIKGSESSTSTGFMTPSPALEPDL